MLGRAPRLLERGYSVLAIDLPGHGESSGDVVTMGPTEGLGVDAALSYLSNRFPQLPVAIVGFSLGASAALHASELDRVDALVLEGVFPTLQDATERRIELRLGRPAAKIIAPLLLVQMRFRAGVPASDVSPLRQVPNVSPPILFIAGSADRRTPPTGVEALFEAAAGVKEMWTIEGARHEDFHAYASDEYETRLFDFLDRHVGEAGPLGSF